jgi:hypothetical protein
MRIHSTTRYAALAALLGGLACAGNKARTDETTQPNDRAAARDTTTVRDTLGGQAENPPGYRGMERDTTQVPPTSQTPTDTFLQHQGQGQPQDTAGYSGVERVDTSGQHAQPGQAQPSPLDTTGYRHDSTGAAGVRDSSKVGADTTGYSPSQQPGDSTAR